MKKMIQFTLFFGVLCTSVILSYFLGVSSLRKSVSSVVSNNTTFIVREGFDLTGLPKWYCTKGNIGSYPTNDKVNISSIGFTNGGVYGISRKSQGDTSYFVWHSDMPYATEYDNATDWIESIKFTFKIAGSDIVLLPIELVDIMEIAHP